MAWEATATVPVGGTPWTIFEMSDSTWFATQNGLTYFVPFTEPTSISTFLSSETSTFSPTSDGLSSSVATPLQHARIMAMSVGIIGCILFTGMALCCAWRTRKFRHVKKDRGLHIHVERAVAIHDEHRPPPLLKESSMFAWGSKLRRARSMELPIHSPPACLLHEPNESKYFINSNMLPLPYYAHIRSFSFGNSHAETISPYLLPERSLIGTKKKRMSMHVISICTSDSILLPPYPPPTYAQSTTLASCSQFP